MYISQSTIYTREEKTLKGFFLLKAIFCSKKSWVTEEESHGIQMIDPFFTFLVSSVTLGYVLTSVDLKLGTSHGREQRTVVFLGQGYLTQ